MAKPPKDRILIVMKVTIKGESGYGICDNTAKGRKWYFYAYRTAEEAEKVRLCMNTQSKIDVNVSRTDLPFSMWPRIAS